MKKFVLVFGIFLSVFGIAKAASAATLKLSPTSGSYTAGQIFTVDVNLDTTGANVDGVDLYRLHFNQNVLQVQDSDSGTSGIQIGDGHLLPLTLTNTADNAAGTIIFSQL